MGTRGTAVVATPMLFSSHDAVLAYNHDGVISGVGDRATPLLDVLGRQLLVVAQELTGKVLAVECANATWFVAQRSRMPGADPRQRAASVLARPSACAVLHSIRLG